MKPIAAKIEPVFDSSIEKWFYQFGWEEMQYQYCVPHPIKVRLADQTWYEPDFMCWSDGDSISMIEIKPAKKDDAILWRRRNGGDSSRIKWKIAAELYPQFLWVAVGIRKVDGRFQIVATESR